MTPQQWAQRATMAAQAGKMPEALHLLEQGLAVHARDAGLWHFTGKLLLQADQAGRAADHFGKAHALLPTNASFAVDQAIALSSAGRHWEALAVLDRIKEAGRTLPAYCSTRGNCERNLGNLAAAGHWFDRALALDARRTKALHGRACVAMERGESDALARFDAALAVDPGNAQLWLGKAQALDIAGDSAGARAIAEQLVQQAPAFTDGLFLLAQLRHAAGEADFAAHYADAMARVPQDPNVSDNWGRTLAGMDRNTEAAEVMARARAAFPTIERFALMEAIYAGAGGDDARAEAIFATLDEQSTDRLLHEARHRMRRGEHDRAEALLAQVMLADPADVRGWALRGIAWRLLGDPREDWLHQQAGLHDLLPLRHAERVLPPAIACLHRLHDCSPLPLGQSLRGGTQTRGQLFDRIEPELSALHAAIAATLEDYRAALPAHDSSHPLLRHSAANWRISGSWSVRLAGGGDHHTSHIHPQGIVSSALYCLLPECLKGNERNREGWLELGRPPPDLRLDLPPIRVIEPREGHLALFPSTLYHGTLPFGEGRRMTVAFDVTLAEAGWQ